MVKTLIKTIFHYFIRPITLIHLSSERNFRYGDIHLTIKPGVFHPGFFFSTKRLLNYLKDFPLQNRTFLELGAGSGLISIYAAKQKAIVTATDISGAAIEALEQNAKRNNVSINIVNSDLFEEIPPQIFDIIAINPPYYPQQPNDERDHAWYCGENFEYFEKLFAQLPRFINDNSQIIMILSEVSPIDRIQQVANRNHCQMRLVHQQKVLWEMKYIFEINCLLNGR